MSLETFDVIWLTGQPGAGKTTLGEAIKNEIGQNTILIDGDDIRLLFDNQDYSIEGRRKNIEFVQKLIEFSIKNNHIPIVCLVSPFLDLREQTKTKFKTLEIYVHCQDIRGREHFHVDYYEKPQKNYLEIDTSGKTVEQSFKQILNRINHDEFSSQGR
ncbi:MAG: adenylyl-sulfate kinase [Crocinitomicaceae bacterium]|nr:MAG: adenylyl-sulfate kinase [Crocinitomicaceae bacterium]